MTIELQSLVAGNSKTKAHLGRNILRLNTDITAFGVRPIYETDFDAYRKAVIENSERGTITGVFDSNRCQIGPENGFWIRGVDDTGRTVHAQAIRFDDIGEQSLAHHWRENLDLFAPTGMNVDLSKTNLITAPASHEISGGVCYHGDFWMGKGARKFGLAPLLSDLAQQVALIRFGPDYLYCLIVPRLIKKGWAAQQGYLHTHPWAPSWHIRGEDEPFDEYLVWTTGPELEELSHPGKRDDFIKNGIGQGNKRRRPVMENEAGY